MLFNSAIVMLSFANKVVKVQPRKFVRSLYGVPRTLQYECTFRVNKYFMYYLPCFLISVFEKLDG